MFGDRQQQPHMTTARRLRRSVACVLVALSLASVALADDEEDEMKGFIVDQCVSRIGHDFYNAFADRLRSTSRLDFNLVVRERPNPRWGSLIWVEFEQRTLYRRFLAPNAVAMEDIATEAADLVKDQIAQQKLQTLLQDTTDLEKDEI